MIRLVLLLLACCPGLTLATPPWTFSEPLTVDVAGDAAYFHHLDGSGRRHLVASETEVALAWEDDRGGAPQVYVAIKSHEGVSFSRAYQLSSGEEAYEPAIAMLTGDRWIAAWEQDGSIVACLIDAQGPGPILQLVSRGGRQVTLATHVTGRIAVVWARKHEHGQLIEATQLRIDKRQLQVVAGPEAVAAVGAHPFQGYPAAAWTAKGRLLIAWEDRRAGHTRLFHTAGDGGLAFSPERQLNEHNAPAEMEPAGKGLGSGVMRVALAVDGTDTVRAVWLDKRNPTSGYAVWGAASSDGGVTFMPNEIVQDELGATVPQWHASLAAGKTIFVATWDDTREAWGAPAETGDVVLSWNAGKAWSTDLIVPGASGEGYQGSPTVAIDPQGDLHLAWIDRDDLGSPTRLRYLRGIIAQP